MMLNSAATILSAVSFSARKGNGFFDIIKLFREDLINWFPGLSSCLFKVSGFSFSANPVFVFGRQVPEP
jgi:hypothetical protein